MAKIERVYEIIANRKEELKLDMQTEANLYIESEKTASKSNYNKFKFGLYILEELRLAIEEDKE